MRLVRFRRRSVRLEFGAGRRHRALLARQGSGGPVRLWVDGREVAARQPLDTLGSWTGGRIFTVPTEGPEDHPEQAYGPGVLVTRILGLLMHDADTSATWHLVPEDHETWTWPCVTLHGDEVRVHPDVDARVAGRPDRVIRLDRPGP